MEELEWERKGVTSWYGWPPWQHTPEGRKRTLLYSVSIRTTRKGVHYWVINKSNTSSYDPISKGRYTTARLAMRACEEDHYSAAELFTLGVQGKALW